MELRKIFIMVLATWLLTACGADEKSDAFGQFEADEVTVSAEVGGKLLSLSAGEGDLIEKDDEVGLLEHRQLILKRDELTAQLESVRARIDNIEAQAEVVREQLSTAETNLKRLQALLEDSAATRQQVDDAEGGVRSLRKEISALQTQKRSVQPEIETMKARIAQLQEQIEDAVITNPVNGRVLNVYVEPHELIQPGQPIYDIADLDTLDLRVYISGAQLPGVRLGQQVEVLVDKNRTENQAFSGWISWISSEAEFTPKMIQTKEERVNQVYAVKIRVPNPDGVLKIGMPGEINF